MEISDIVISYRVKSKIKLPDAIILATCKILSADLTTANSDDFKNVDKSIKIINPFHKN
ncbi:MAG: toxin-antitoxin system, toxin component, PIN domain protein [bacterium]